MCLEDSLRLVEECPAPEAVPGGAGLTLPPPPPGAAGGALYAGPAPALPDILLAQQNLSFNTLGHF
jgi:hypothetical protein